MHHQRSPGASGSIILAVISMLVGLAGCGVLSRQQPGFRPIPPPPEEYRADGVEGRLVWKEGNLIAGFAMNWVEPDSLEPGWPLSPPTDLAPPADSMGLEMRVFARYFARRRLGRNQLLLTLADGSTVRSLDLWLGPPAGRNRRFQCADVTPIEIDAMSDPEFRGQDLFVFVPRWASEHDVVAVERVHDLGMRVVLERNQVLTGAPVGGYVALENLSEQPITLVLNHSLGFRDGVLTVTGPDGRVVNCSERSGSEYPGLGESHLDISARGSLRLPFLIMRRDRRMLFDEPGEYTVSYSAPTFELSASAALTVSAPRHPEPSYLEFFDRYESFNGVFTWGKSGVAKLRALREELGPTSEYAEAMDLILDYREGGHELKSLLDRAMLWQHRVQAPHVVAAMAETRRFNRDLWAYVRESQAAGRPVPVHGATYYDGCRHF